MANSKRWQDNSDGWVTTMNASKEMKEKYVIYMKKESLKLFFYKDSQLFKKVVIKEDFSLMVGSNSNCDLIISY